MQGFLYLWKYNLAICEATKKFYVPFSKCYSPASEASRVCCSIMFVNICYPPAIFSCTIVTLMEETNRSSHSDTKKLDHFIICNITVISSCIRSYKASPYAVFNVAIFHIS